MGNDSLVVIEAHPVQYHAPLYRLLQKKFNIPVTAVYGSDFSARGYYDKEFKTFFTWDSDLLSGYSSIFLSSGEKNKITQFYSIFNNMLIRRVEKILKEINPKAVMIVGYNSLFYQLAFHEAYKRGYPIFFRAETTDHAHKRSDMKKWLRNQILTRTYKMCSKLLYIGKNSFKHFNRIGVDEQKLIFSPYCVDKSLFQCSEESRKHFRELVRENLKITENEIALLFCGKLSLRKGPDLFLEAVKKLLLTTNKNISVIFLGHGKLKSYLKKKGHQNPMVKIHFIGFKNQSQMSPYYHAADLLVMPSRSDETWGLVVNEALQHGLPCVVSETVGCGPDLIEPGITGEKCRANSSASLTLAIQRAFALMKKQNIRKKCREKSEAYTMEKAAEGIAKAYQGASEGLTKK